MSSGGYRDRLYEVFSRADGSVERQVTRALEIGTDYLDLPIGFLTRIEDGTQRIAQTTGNHEAIREGETCPLDEAYCRRTVELDGALAIHDVAASRTDGGTTEVGDAAVRRFGLGTYIGARVVVDEDVYGTVCFAAEGGRTEPFSEREELFVELLARLVGGAFERRQYERDLEARNERLRREKRRFEGIAEASSDILFRVDSGCRLTYVSEAAERVLGYDPERMVGDSIYDYAADDGAETAAAYERVLKGERVDGVELAMVDADGDRVDLEVNASPIIDDGSVVGVQGVGRDVTDRKARERELHMKTRAMDEATVGVSIADPTEPGEPLVYVNDAFEAVTGYDAAEAVGRNCRFLQGPETDPESVAELRETIDAGESTTVELLNYRRDGTPFWNRITLTPVYDDAGELAHYLGFQRDVTERRRRQTLIELLNRVLRHNLRNDMTAISGWAAELASGSRGDPASIGERIESIADELVDLSEHARELERYARTEPEPERLNLGGMLTAVADEHRPAATVDVRADTDRAACAGRELQRAVAELVENAVKHHPGDPTVELAARDDGEWIELTVDDDGPGIDDLEAAVISSGDETPLQHGSGLGLWLVNWIVTRYGGSFQIDGDDDGTTATIRLPAVADEEDVASAARRPTVLFQ